MTDVFCWGGNSQGQLGLANQGGESILQPQQLEKFQGREIQQIGCGLGHSLIALKDGSLYSCGNNDYGQLGQAKSRGKPELITAFETGVVRVVACGAYHSLAVTDTKQVYSWGCNSHGQLGRGEGDKDSHRVPRLIKGFNASNFVVQVACGDKHTLLLSRDGSTYVFGDHSHGQLGMGNLPQGKLDTPVRLKCMLGLPIGQIAAGGHHSFALTLSGTLFGWGKNRFGQLGVGDEKDRLFPTLAKSVRSQRIKYVCCGEDHTVLLTQEGGVFTFGCGSHGQLGHNSLNNELLPRKVFELMGSEVTQIACARRHTLALVPLRGRVYSFGHGANGQLGIGNTSNCNSPATVKGPWVPAVLANNGPSSFEVRMEVDDMDNKQEAYVIRTIFCGGDQCFMYTAKPDLHMHPEDFRNQKPQYSLLTVNQDIVERCVDLQKDIKPPSEVTMDLEMAFSSASCLNGSFLFCDNRHLGSSRHNNGIDFDAAQDIFQKFKDAQNPSISQLICASLEQQLLPSLPSSPPDIEAMRLYLVLPFCHVFENPNVYSTIICPFGQSIINLDKVATKVIDQWWSKYRSRDFKRLVTIYKQCVVFILQEPHAKNEFEVLVRQKGLFVSMEILRKLNTVNDGVGQIIPYDNFYISELKDKVDIRADYVNWIQSKGSGSMLSFCNYPFVFDAQAKTLLLHTDAVMQMQLAVDEVHRRNFSSLFIPTIDPVNPCLVLYIDRNNVVQDTINQLAKQGSTDFKKPLKVVFLGEEAQDEGGVRKEFFLLLLREILDPKYGMFRYYDESRMIWFNNKTFEDPVMFFLIGVLCGLAIYNNTIIDLPFPQALYKKLLKRPVVMDDLRELMPDVGKNMQELLDFEDDVQEAFCLNFVIVEDNFGEPEHIELIPHGENIDVTAENRQQYIDAYIDHIFNKSVQIQFDAFHTGFLKVCGGRVLDLFHPAELQAMVVGNENYDWEELEKTAEYKGEYWRNHPTIKNFWEVFREMSVSQKKKFLLFLTGSDRIPILGMKAVKIYIQPTGGGEEYLPVAHTCFNLLDLPKFTSKDKLREKLLQAVEQSEGFGLV